MPITLQDIIQNSDYALTIFSPEEIAAIELFEKKGRPYLRDFSNAKERPAKPEEIVRQLFLYRLLNTYKYPASRISVEKGVQFGSSIAEKRADLVVHDKDDKTAAYIIVEIKKPKRKDGLEQLKSYCNAEGAPIAVWTNGGEEVTLRRTEPNVYQNLYTVPRADQTLAEIINERVTIEDLARRNKLVTEKWTLKKIILDLENLVLANAGVDAFEEVFKLIYAKLYDESQAKKRKGHFVEFRASGETHSELFEKINNLFEDAKKRWPGVFLDGEKIELSPDALAVCVSFLQDIKLFNSNLQIIDEAFEYLSTQVAKGAKGQYFTPRYVIDMCVRMLNPKDGEYMIDTASGSCGFTVHTMFYVWGGELTSDGPTHEQAEYANEYVYGLDFDTRSVKIAKALNLIAGDGKTNVYRVNSLAPFQWSEDARVGLKPRLRHFAKPADTQENAKSYREFEFDIVMTNPPFAGDVSDSRILHQYELAKQWKGIDLEELADVEERERYADSPFRFAFKESGKWAQNQSRDLLFVERNLQFLKPGGRMAIVLPQGRFNNLSDARLRHFISEHGRILAVVGLHGNTFKPHTGTKTSVLFLQKWNEDPKVGALCTRVEDYPIFFATSEHGGKDNSGEYIFLKDADGEKLHDLFNHEIVDQDLFDVRVVLRQQLEKLRERDSDNLTLLDVHQERYSELLKHLPQRPTIAEAFIDFCKTAKFFVLARGRSIMAVWSEVGINDLSPTSRIDPEYYQPVYLANIDFLQNRCVYPITPLGKLLTSISGGATPSGAEYPNEGVPFLRVQNIMPGYLSLHDVVYIPELVHNTELKRSKLSPGDVLLTITGVSYGKSAYVTSTLGEANINQHSVRMSVTSEILPEYLTTFLNCRFGKLQTDMKITGITRPALDYGEVRTILVPILPEPFQEEIKEILNKAEQTRQHSLELYVEAENLLLKELGLDTLDLTHHATPVLRAQVGAIHALKDCAQDPAKKQQYNSIISAWRNEEQPLTLRSKGEVKIKFSNLAYEYCVIHYYADRFFDELNQKGLLPTPFYF